MLHFTPTLSNPTSPKALEESMQNVIKSTEDIINDDFERIKISESPFADFSWSPYSGISPSMMTANHERKPFDVINQHPRFANSYQGFSPNQNFSQENRSFSQNQERIQLRDIGNLNRELSQPKMQKSTSDTMKYYGNKPSNAPLLKVSYTAQPEFELEEKHIRNLFGRFGSVMKVMLSQNRTAYVVLDNPMNALTAQKALNKCYLKDLNITLYVNFCHGIEEDSRPQAEPKLELNLGRLQKHHMSNGSDKENDSSAMNAMNGKRSIYTFSPQELSFLPNTVTAKFTCKYEVQIENEKEFRVAQKIIGSRGYNMKKIIEICQSQVKNPNIVYKSDFLKLRLRGKGSGFKEGPDQRESDEPIHLCVSSRYNDVFETACKLVEELLAYVYKEYETFCKVTNRKANLPLQIKKQEMCSGSNNDRQTPENFMDMFTSPNNFNAYPSPNNQMFYSNENYPFGNVTTPSPRNNFGGENRYKQFGQERMVNPINERVQISPFQSGEGMSSHLNYH